MPDVRQRIIETVFDGQLNGAQAARVFNVSEATVHRILKAARGTDPETITSTCEAAPERTAKYGRSQHQQRVRKALSVDQERAIVERLFAGSDFAVDLAHEFKVHKSTISRILKASKPRIPDRSTAIYQAERNRRVAEGISKAASAGKRNGRKSKLSTETQEMIVNDAAADGVTYVSLAVRYNVSSTTISRVVRASRVKDLAVRSQSLDEFFAQILVSGARK